MIDKIAIGGYAGSGKTTVSEHLSKKYGYELLGFATPLYELADIHQLSREERFLEIAKWTEKHLAPSGYSSNFRDNFTWLTYGAMTGIPVEKGKNRTLLQVLGTEVGRYLDVDLWTKLFINNYQKYPLVINDNLRFPNEIKNVKNLGFKVIFIETPLELRKERYLKRYGKLMSEEELNHPSEKYLDYIRENSHYHYTNTGNEKALVSAIEKFIK